MLFSFFLLKLRLGYTTDAVGSKVGIPGLDATQAAKILIALLFPLGHQVAVGQALTDAVLEELFTDGLPLVVEVEHVSRLLVVDLEDGPQRLNLALTLVRLCLTFAHFLFQFVECGFDQLPALRRRFLASSHFAHV